MTREQREVLEQRICNFYCEAAKKSVKTTINYFKKQNIPQNTVYYIFKKISTIWNDRRLFLKWSSSQIIHKRFVKSVNNRCGLSQCNDFEFINRLFPVIFDSEHRLLYENVKKL